MREDGRPDEHRSPVDDAAVDELHTGEAVVGDHQAGDLAGRRPGCRGRRAALAPVGRARRCGRRTRRRRTTGGRAARARPNPGWSRARRGAGRGPPSRGSTGSAAGLVPIARGRRACRGVVADAGGHEHAPRCHVRGPAVEVDDEGRLVELAGGEQLQRSHGAVDDLDAVAGDLGPAGRQQLATAACRRGRGSPACARRGRCGVGRRRSRRPCAGPGPAPVLRSGRQRRRRRSPRRRSLAVHVDHLRHERPAGFVQFGNRSVAVSGNP